MERFVNKNSVSVITDIETTLKKVGYKVQIKNLNAAWYGSHTKRTRTFVVGVRKDIRKEFEFPKISHFDFKTKLIGVLIALAMSVKLSFLILMPIFYFL